MEVSPWCVLNFYLNNSGRLIANFAPNANDNYQQYTCYRWQNYVENRIHKSEFRGTHWDNFLCRCGSWAWLNHRICCFITYCNIKSCWSDNNTWIFTWRVTIKAWRNDGTTWITARWVWWVSGRTISAIVWGVTSVIYLLLYAIWSRICDNYDLWSSRDTLIASSLRRLVVNRPAITLQVSLT